MFALSLSRPAAELPGVAWVSHGQEGSGPFQAGIPQGRIGLFLAGGDVKSIVKTSNDGWRLVTPLASDHK